MREGWPRKNVGASVIWLRGIRRYERGLQHMNGHPLVLPLLEEVIYGTKANILDI
jgi:hypothetical protein